jgi:CP family cyanate transporter-like MFS transporter
MAGNVPRGAEELPAGRRDAGGVLLGVSLILVAFNLRPVFSSLSTLLPEIMRSTGLGTVGASLLTTAPVLCLGLFSFAAPRLSRRFGAERIIVACLILLTLGTALRGVDWLPTLFAGTMLAGAAIAVVNVLLPGLVKRDFPSRSAMMTGLYTMALCGGAAAAAAFTVPIEKAFGGAWTAALASWALPSLLTLLLFMPQATRARAAAAPRRVTVSGLERGLDAVTAGLVVSVSVMAQMAACLVVPSIATRRRDQKAVNAALCGLAVGGFLLCAFGPLSTIWFSSILLGLGQGGLIAAAMTLIILRAPDVDTAARLSSMAQGVGYTLAAIGPLLAGALRGMTGDFRASTLLFATLGALAAINGWGAGRARHVRVDVRPFGTEA